MNECWKEDPFFRPSFYQLIEKLEVIMQRDAPYLEMKNGNDAIPYHVPPAVSTDDELDMEEADPQWSHVSIFKDGTRING